MRSYEGFFIFPPESTPDARKNQLKNLDDLIARYKGEVSQKIEWGKKSLGYAVRKFQEGHFLCYDFQMDPSQATEFRKGLQLQEELIKFTVTLKPVIKVPVEKKASAPKAASATAAPSRPAKQPVSSAPTSHS